LNSTLDRMRTGPSACGRLRRRSLSVSGRFRVAPALRCPAGHAHTSPPNRGHPTGPISTASLPLARVPGASQEAGLPLREMEARLHPRLRSPPERDPQVPLPGLDRPVGHRRGATRRTGHASDALDHRRGYPVRLRRPEIRQIGDTFRTGPDVPPVRDRAPPKFWPWFSLRSSARSPSRLSPWL